MTNVRERLDELALLEDGWYDGNGFALNREGLHWLADQLEYQQLTPWIYPEERMTYDTSGVRLEWGHCEWDAGLEINLNSQLGYWHDFDRRQDDDYEITLDLSQPEAWQTIKERLVTHGD